MFSIFGCFKFFCGTFKNLNSRINDEASQGRCSADNRDKTETATLTSPHYLEEEFKFEDWKGMILAVCCLAKIKIAIFLN